MNADPASSEEARLLRDFFRDSATGSFVEVGVPDPVRGSRTLHLEEAGWIGIVAEPRPDVAAFLVAARKARNVAAACVAPDVAGQPLALRIANPLSSVDVGQPWQPEQPAFTVMVPTRTLDGLLAEAGMAAPLDLVALDAEGRELDALLGLDFERWQPRLIVIADPVTDLQRHRFLKESGYVLIWRVGGCGWYVPGDSRAVRKRRLWPVLRDYYLALPFRKAGHALRRLKSRVTAAG